LNAFLQVLDLLLLPHPCAINAHPLICNSACDASLTE
jgi:hypothetical protein